MSLHRSVVLGAIPPAIARVNSNALSHEIRAESFLHVHGLTVLRWPAVLSLWALLACTTAHAQVPAGPNRPIGVPDGYVITASGYFHPSCVRQLAEGDTLDEDGPAIEHADGSRENVLACEYPHYTARGEVAIEGSAESWPAKISQDWIEAAMTTKGSPYGELDAIWTVPPAPTSNDQQTVAFFPGFEQTGKSTSILQPALFWNNASGGWFIVSENCCYKGNPFTSPPMAVKPGDKITGFIQQTCVAGTPSCTTWAVTTMDVNTGGTTTLPSTSSLGHTFNLAFAGVLEVINLVQCSDYPSNGQVTFSGVTLYDYNFHRISNPPWKDFVNTSLTPQCGYGVQVAAKQVTLDYATFVTFDPSGSIYTSPQSINTSGAITGSYNDAGYVVYGFVRDPSGNITSFDPSGSISTIPTSINTSGAITGYYFDASSVAHGFVGRAPY